MASTKLVHSEIDRFLSSVAPEVLCITGKWGVGKTYSWKYFVHQAQARKTIALNRYAYVSLFGQNSLQDVRSTIFEETADVGEIDKSFDLSSLSSLANKAKSYGPWLFNHARNFVPWLKNAPDITARWLFLTVRKQIVCFDDLERAGAGLDIKDILGLVSFLREERDCKVVLLLNEDELDERQEEYKTLLEKVIDVRLEFEPTAAEAATIGLTDSPIKELLFKNCTKLGIVNIRVIKKIERLALELAELLKNYDPDVLRQAIHSVALFGWCIYQPREAPPLAFVQEFSAYKRLLSQKDEATGEEKAWRALLQEYQFISTDELDEAILEGVQDGAFDSDCLNAAATPLAAKLDFQRRDASFSDAWSLLHRSFNTSADEVLDKMAAAFRGAAKTITPMNLSSTVSLFKEFGRPEQAKELLEFYLNTRSSENTDLFDLQKSPFGGEVKDPDVRAAFAAKVTSTDAGETPKAVLLRIGRNQGWSQEDLVHLASMSAEDYKTVFKSIEGAELPAVINAALNFGKFGNATGEMKTITANATSALRSIATESPINARRVASYGISPDTST